MMNRTDEISKAFSLAANSYERAATIQQEIGQRLLARLQYLNITPKYILDLGCGPGFFSKALSQLYPKACVLGLDLSPQMLLQAKKKQGFRSKWPLLAADMQRLPFADGSIDLIFANQVLHWGSSLTQVFSELNRVLSNNACIMFTSLGPDTFKEIKSAWALVDSFSHVNEFCDMHDVGDALLSEYFVDPVMDMEWIAMHYKSLQELLRALKDQGVRHIHTQRNQGLTGRSSWKQFEQHYQAFRTDKGKYPLTYEVVYGHAWKGARRKTNQGTETLIDVRQITKR